MESLTDSSTNYSDGDTINQVNESLTLDSSSSSNGFNDEMVYYSVYVPEQELSELFDKTLIFTDKLEALKSMKQNKKARLKSFASESEAKKFLKCGPELMIASSPSTGSDKALFSGPKFQDLVKFRKAIENDDLLEVQKYVDENPRYLVGSGDTPTILQEGARYNALHVAARSNSKSACSYVLSTISNANFMKKLYGLSNTNLEERCGILVDLYLNTPDKAGNETPLHFASKLGAIDVVKILLSYPQCDKFRTNKSGLTAIDIVCTRATAKTKIFQHEIHDILNTQFYIPVLRSTDNSVPPVIGEPFTPANPPEVTSPSVISSPLQVTAFAGPMTENDARIFRKKWKTPPRLTERYRPELSDPEKGLEKIGRKLAQEIHIQWKEYWPFLNCFTDIQSQEGLSALENHLKNRFQKVPSSHFDFSQPLVKQDFDPFEVALRNDSPLFYDGYRHGVCKSSKKPIISATTMEKSCQVFASRIGFAATNGIKNAILSEVTKFQFFLGGCFIDNRFMGIQLNKAHYRLSALISEKLELLAHDISDVKSTVNQLPSSALKYHSEDNKLPSQNLIKATNCISGYIIKILSSNSEIDKPSKETLDEVSPEELWNLAESCRCDIPVIKSVNNRYLPRKLFLEKATNNNDNKSDNESSSEESSDDEFFTAPNSPCSSVPSSPTLSVDMSPMYPALSGPDIFLTSDKPSKLDKTIIEALGDINIPIDIYPHIFLWKKTCLEHMKEEPCEKWGTPLKPNRFLK